MLDSQDPVTPGAARMKTAQRTHAQNERSLCLAWTSVLYSLYSNPATTISVVPESTTYIVTCHPPMAPPFASLMTGPTGPKDVAPTLAYRHSGYWSVYAYGISTKQESPWHVGCQGRVVGKANQDLPPAHHPSLSTIMLRWIRHLTSPLV